MPDDPNTGSVHGTPPPWQDAHNAELAHGATGKVKTTVSEPITDDDLAAIERLLMHGVIGTDPANASGATIADVAESAIDLLAEVKRLQEERSAMLDVIEAAEAALDRKSLHTEPCECANCLLLDALARFYDLIGGDDA